MISSLLLYAAAALAAVGAAAHADYRASGSPGGVLTPDQARLGRNVALALAAVAACVGASLKAGGF